MNFYKNFIKTCPKYCNLNVKYVFNRNFHNIFYRRTITDSGDVKYKKFSKRKSCLRTKMYCSTYNFADIAEIEEITDLYPYLQSQHLSNSDKARSVLYQNNNDYKILELGKCASVEEVFSFVRKNSTNLNDKYLTQIVLVLSDLQNMFFYRLDEETDVKEDFFRKVLEHQEFYAVVNGIDKVLDTYDSMFLSYTMLYLHKLGLPVESQLIQNMAVKIKQFLQDKFSLDISARFFRVIFAENSVRPYYTAINIIPKVFDAIVSIQTLKELEDLTSCLNMLHHLITDDIIDQYLEKINNFIDSQKLKGSDYQVLLKILALLSYPNFRNKHSFSISKYILLMKDSIELMNYRELEVLYHVFFKCQEPGSVLNTLQRACAKCLHEQEDSHIQKGIQLELFCCLIYFSSPNHKVQFRRDIDKYINKKATFNSLVNVRKVFSYLKISDVKLCDLYWTKAWQSLKEPKEFDKVLKLFESYLMFLTDNLNYRSYAFEHHIMRIIEKHFESGTLTIFPQQFFPAFNFVLLFCKDLQFRNRFMDCFKERKSQITAADLLKISQVLNLMRNHKNMFITDEEITDLRNILNEVTAKLYKYREEVEPNTLLIKAAILRNEFENELIDDILESCKDIKYMSSKMLENLSFSLFAPKALIPEILNKCTEYVVHHKDRILGFNAEKILSMCYYLNYYPVHADHFFRTVIDLVIRDQERLTGLSFLQAALSLCYFNHLPNSFIKQIFNVEFLDKLDVELENCYYRDSYPHRVRATLMQLNRAVCLEYPEFNVPWFHQKYIDEVHKIYAQDDISGNLFQRNVKDYLMGVIDKDAILEYVRAPYGYTINFVIHFDKDNKPTTNFNDENNLKLALLLKKDSAFTRFYIRLKGKHELQKRHLEIMGYKVKIIKRNDWANLLYASERIEFIKSLVFS